LSAPLSSEYLDIISLWFCLWDCFHSEGEILASKLGSQLFQNRNVERAGLMQSIFCLNNLPL